jgi:hypothetical protein
MLFGRLLITAIEIKWDSSKWTNHKHQDHKPTEDKIVPMTNIMSMWESIPWDVVPNQLGQTKRTTYPQ